MVVRGEGEVELANLSVEGDQLVGAGGVSMPLADVLMLETREFSLGRTIGLVLGTVVLVPVALIAALLIDCGGTPLPMY